MAARFLRYLFLLREIPVEPDRIDTTFLIDRLRRRGIGVSRRTVQRDLERLAQSLPIRCIPGTRPYAWVWLVGAEEPWRSQESLRDVVERVAGRLDELGM